MNDDNVTAMMLLLLVWYYQVLDCCVDPVGVGPRSPEAIVRWTRTLRQSAVTTLPLELPPLTSPPTAHSEPAHALTAVENPPVTISAVLGITRRHRAARGQQ